MDKLEDDKKGLKLWVFENLLATVFQSSFVRQEAVILSFASDFFVNVKLHGAVRKQNWH